MEERISTIKKLELKKEDILSMVMFNNNLNSRDLSFLEEEFDFYKEEIDNFVASYKNIGVVFRLAPTQEEFATDWKMFIQRIIKKTYDFDNFNNVFANKSYDKILLVTNKRLLKLDLKRLNEKIEEINFRIRSFDQKVAEEMEELAEATRDTHSGLFNRFIKVLKK